MGKKHKKKKNNQLNLPLAVKPKKVVAPLVRPVAMEVVFHETRGLVCAACSMPIANCVC